MNFKLLFKKYRIKIIDLNNFVINSYFMIFTQKNNYVVLLYWCVNKVLITAIFLEYVEIKT